MRADSPKNRYVVRSFNLPVTGNEFLFLVQIRWCTVHRVLLEKFPKLLIGPQLCQKGGQMTEQAGTCQTYIPVYIMLAKQDTTTILNVV